MFSPGSPIYTTSSILTSIQSLLTGRCVFSLGKMFLTGSITDPNPESPANAAAAKLFETDKKVSSGFSIV